MIRLILATGSDENYLNKIRTYLSSLSKNSNFDKNILVYLGKTTIDVSYNNIDIAYVKPEDIVKPNKNNCLQHGEFLNSQYFDSVNDEDIICFTDGDMTLQRNLTSNEIDFIKSLKDGDVFVGYNESPSDTLYNEYYRLMPNTSHETIYPGIEKIKVYNTGVLVMNKKTWLALKDQYVKLFDDVDKIFQHYAKQQWLISYIINTNNFFKIYEMDYVYHNHTHYPSPKGTSIDHTGIVSFNNKTVLFKHRWI